MATRGGAFHARISDTHGHSYRASCLKNMPQCLARLGRGNYSRKRPEYLIASDQAPHFNRALLLLRQPAVNTTSVALAVRAHDKEEKAKERSTAAIRRNPNDRIPEGTSGQGAKDSKPSAGITLVGAEVPRKVRRTAGRR